MAAATVAQTTTLSKAFYATLDTTEGTALRTADGSVHFLTTASGVWQRLFDTDIPRLQLHGRCDLAAWQASLDGDLVVKASRTVQGRR